VALLACSNAGVVYEIVLSSCKAWSDSTSYNIISRSAYKCFFNHIEELMACFIFIKCAVGRHVELVAWLFWQPICHMSKKAVAFATMSVYEGICHQKRSYQAVIDYETDHHALMKDHTGESLHQ